MNKKVDADFVIEKIAEKVGKSVKMLLFEFQKDKHPITFKRWIKEEQARKTGKKVSFVCGAPDITPIIELIDGQLVETPFPEELGMKLMVEY